MPFHVGDQVTILGPYASDPVIVEMRKAGVVAKVLPGDRYMIRLGLTVPPGKTYGPFPGTRLTRPATQWVDGGSGPGYTVPRKA